MSSDAIAFEDALPLLKAAPPEEEVTVIGGQALNFWAERFRDKFVEFLPFTSGDLDLMGDAVAAAEYARAWGGKLLLQDTQPLQPAWAQHRVGAQAGAFSDRGGERAHCERLHDR